MDYVSRQCQLFFLFRSMLRRVMHSLGASLRFVPSHPAVEILTPLLV